MAPSVRIGVIGAGSAVFSLGLVKDLCLTRDLRAARSSFMDIEPERLEIVHRAGRTLRRRAGAACASSRRPTARRRCATPTS